MISNKIPILYLGPLHLTFPEPVYPYIYTFEANSVTTRIYVSSGAKQITDNYDIIITLSVFYTGQK